MHWGGGSLYTPLCREILPLTQKIKGNPDLKILDFCQLLVAGNKIQKFSFTTYQSTFVLGSVKSPMHKRVNSIFYFCCLGSPLLRRRRIGQQENKSLYIIGRSCVMCKGSHKKVIFI